MSHNNAGRIPTGSRDRVIAFDTLEQKAKWIDAAASLDSMRLGVRAVARPYVARYKSAEDRTTALHDFVRDRIHYETDYRVSQKLPGEEFADSESILRRGYDDCDGKSRLFVALMRAAEAMAPLGTEARIRPVFRPHVYQFVHVQVEVRWPGSESLSYATPQGWILAEMILKGCRLGQDPDDVPRGANGERQLA